MAGWAKEPELYLSFPPFSYGPHKSSSILPLTGILFKDKSHLGAPLLPLVCTSDKKKKTCTAQTERGNPVCRHPCTHFLCSAHTQRLYANLPYQVRIKRWGYPSWTLTATTCRRTAQYWIKCMNVFFVCFFLKSAITPNFTVQEISIMVQSVV